MSALPNVWWFSSRLHLLRMKFLRDSAAAQPGAPPHPYIRFMPEDGEIPVRHLCQQFIALPFVVGSDDRFQTDAFVRAALQDDLGLHGRKLEEGEHLPDFFDIIQIMRRVQREAAVAQMMRVQELHGAVLDLNPLQQIPLEESEPRWGEMLENLLVAGQCPAEMAASVVAAVEMERGVKHLPVFLPTRFALGDVERVAHKMDEPHLGKKFQRGHMVRFQKCMARFEVDVLVQAFDVIALLGQAGADAVDPASVGIVDGGPEKGRVAPVKERFMPAGAAGDVLLKQALQEERSGTGAGEDEKNLFMIFQNPRKGRKLPGERQRSLETQTTSTGSEISDLKRVVGHRSNTLKPKRAYAASGRRFGCEKKEP